MGELFKWSLATAFAIHSFYNLAMISPHSFLVPLITGRTLELPPFMGYRSFSVAAVFASFLIKDATIYAEARNQIEEHQVTSTVQTLNSLHRTRTIFARGELSGRWLFV